MFILFKVSSIFALENIQNNNNVELFQEWPEIQTKVIEWLQGEHLFLGKSAVNDQGLNCF